MYYFAHIEESTKKVKGVSEAQDNILHIDSMDTRLLGTTYDPETGTFSGHKITLAADKQYIMADGVDTIRITATIKTWDDQDAGETFTAPILFIVDSVPKLITKKTAGYYVDYKTTVAGTKEVRTQDAAFISQGSVAVLAVEVEEEPVE